MSLASYIDFCKFHYIRALKNSEIEQLSPLVGAKSCKLFV